MNLLGKTRPLGPDFCCQAILAKRDPSGQGEILPARAAFTATSFPRINRKVLLSPRSVVLIGLQVSKDGSNGNPSNSGSTFVRETGAGTPLGTAAGAVTGSFGAGVH